jgi:hypothetical protein
MLMSLPFVAAEVRAPNRGAGKKQRSIRRRLVIKDAGLRNLVWVASTRTQATG